MAGALLAPSSASAGSNDTMATADGPVTGSITGAIETENDVDWFFFYAQGATQLDIALAGLGPEGSCSRWTVELMNSKGAYLSDARVFFNEVDHIRYTVASPGTYYLKVWGYCEDVGYYRIDIAASPPLLTEPPYIPPPATTTSPGTRNPSRGASRRTSRACQQARGRVRALQRNLRRANLRRARGRHVRRQRARLRANIRRARHQVRRRC